MKQRRVRWVAGSKSSALELDAEQDYLRERQTCAHEIRVHGRLTIPPNGIAKQKHVPQPDDAASGAVGALVRAVDRSVAVGLTALAGLKPVPVQSDQSAAVNPGRRNWAVSVIRDILSVGWTGGAGIAGRINGRLACDGLASSGAVRLPQAVVMPDAPRPFRLLRAAADRKAKTPETVIIELAAAADPNGPKEKPAPPQQSDAKDAKNEPAPTSAGSGKQTIGLRVGAADADGFLPLLEVVPGRGVLMRGGKPNIIGRLIVRKPPGTEPSDEQLAQAFLRTEAGKEERKKIEKLANDLTLGVTFNKSGGQWNISWTLENKGQVIKLKRIEARAALAGTDRTIAPAWTKLRPPKTPHLEKNEKIEGDDTKSLPPPPGQVPAHPPKLFMIVAEADYGVPVTLFKETP
jgi:hypothetical protein